MKFCIRNEIVLASIVLGAVSAYGQAPQLVVLHQVGRSQNAVSDPSTTLVEVTPGVFVGSYIEGLFEITPSGVFSVLSDFSKTTFYGAASGALTPTSNGYLYGVAFDFNGTYGIYRLDRSGRRVFVNQTFSTAGPLTEGSDGNLWGTRGSISNGYSVFKMSLTGSMITVAQGLTGPTNGPLLQASDGNFYGATYPGTSTAAGQIYRVTPSGEYTLLYTFPLGEGSVGGLMQASNGLLYGTGLYSSVAACPGSAGEVFAISLSGAFKSLHQFGWCYPPSYPLGPSAGLIEANNGILYGSTLFQSELGDGTLFQIGLDGSNFQNIIQFNVSDGSEPSTEGPALVQGSDGNLYGTTSGGGAGQGGTIFQLNLGLTPPLPNIRLIQPQAGAPGAEIRLTGNHLLGLTAVSFNGIPATFTPLNVNYAVAVVPTGALTGPITVTTMNGSFTTKTSFVVE